jgi:serine/threonine-protein kinase
MATAGTAGFREATFEGAPRFVELRVVWIERMSRTYAARDRKRGEQVWIKEASSHEDVPEVIAQEYALFRRLAPTVGPHVPVVHELFESEGGISYSGEPLDGVNLAAIFAGHAKDEAWIRRTFHGLVAALDGLHALGFVHRDVNPAQVLVTPEGRAVLMSLEDAGEAGGRSLEVIENSMYMAPERLLGQPATPAQDLYAVGVALFQALTGRSPFEDASSLAQLLLKIRGPAPPPPSSVAAGVAEELDRLCVTMLNPDPAKRPAGQQVLQMLEDRRGMIGGGAPHKR